MTEVIDKYFLGIPKHDLAVFLAFTFFIFAIGLAVGWYIGKFIY
jgi:hypothetical protein